MKSLLRLYFSSFAHLQRKVWILAIVMLINRSGSMVLLFTSLYLTNDLHFTMAEAGIVMSLYGIGSVAGSYWGGWLADRYSHKRVMIAALLICGAILLLLPLTTNYYAICTIVLSYAIAADMFRPANTASIRDYSTPENRTRSISLVRLAANLGFTIGPAVGGFIAFYFSYKLLFVIDAFTSFFAAWMLYQGLPKKDEDDQSAPKIVAINPKTSAYRDGPFLVFIAMVAIYGTCFFQFFASIPQFFNKVSHYTEDTIGLLLALNGLLVVIIEMPLIARIGNAKNMFGYMVLGTLCLPIAFCMLYFGGALIAMAAFYILMITLSEVFAMPFMLNFVLNRPKRERQGQYSALYSIAFGISFIAAPSIGLGLADCFGFNTMFLFFMVLSVLLAFGFYLLGKHKSMSHLQAFDA
jgi:predicted MFS family arabinose efflux permease